MDTRIKTVVNCNIFEVAGLAPCAHRANKDGDPGAAGGRASANAHVKDRLRAFPKILRYLEGIAGMSGK